MRNHCDAKANHGRCFHQTLRRMSKMCLTLGVITLTCVAAPSWPRGTNAHKSHSADADVVCRSVPVPKDTDSANIADPSVVTPMSALLQPRHIIRCRRDHESPIGWMPPNEDPDDNDDPNDDFMPNDQNTDPAFLRRLRERFLQLGFETFDAEFEIPIRTWYLDHVTMRRWTAPRILQLVGPPHTWEPQFTSLWVDQIDPDDWFDVTIVTPDPPRTTRHSFVMVDVILTQSLHMDRYPGLVTVMPEQLDNFELFSVAYSFADFISGFDIVLAADAVSMCRYHPCTITFGWDEIPHSLRPHHAMRPGDGFQVMVRPGQLRLTEPPQPSTAAASSSHEPVQGPSVNASVDLTHSTPSHPLLNDTTHRRFTTPLHLFQLDAHEVIVDLVNAQLAHPSHEIAEAADVPFDCVEAVHMLIARPVDFPELSIPAILQRTGDVPLHSTERLVLVDTIYHHQRTEAHVPSRPTVVRSVHRLPHQVIRPQLLTAAAVYQYCQFLQEQCEVYLDERHWIVTDLAPRPLRHGSYARIEVPPPQGFDVDTVTAATVVEQDADGDEFMELLMDELPDDDATFLSQVAACGTITTDQVRRIRTIFAPIPSCLPSDSDSCLVNYHECHQRIGGEEAQAGSETTQCKHLTDECDMQVRTNDVGCAAIDDEITSSFAADGDKLHYDVDTPMAQPTLYKYFRVATSDKSGDPAIPTFQGKSCDAHQQPPPTFEQSLPTIEPAGNPPRPRPSWQIELESRFDELARVHFTELGPTMFVSVWYVHHGRFPVCHASRLVELDNIRELWYADLCNAWWDHIDRREPIKVIIVRPNPDNQLQPRSQVHIILEQQFHPDGVALVFTAVFLANFRNGVFQKAESVDASICTQYMIDRHQFNQFCDFRPCNMYSGIMRFQHHVPEEVFSGISVTLVVAAPTQAGSSTDPAPTWIAPGA